MNFKQSSIQAIITNALKEDVGPEDYSTLASIPDSKNVNALVLIKQNGIVAGIDLAEEILHVVDSSLGIEKLVEDGQKVNQGTTAMKIVGRVHSILKAERLLLNFMQRLSGIATATYQMTNKIAHTKCKILDTRKTTPNLRILEKWAVLQGGGVNHRFGLYDMVMLKDNHIDCAGGITSAVENAYRYLKENQLKLKIEVETRSIDEVKEVLATQKIDRIMFDNFSPEKIREALKLVPNHIQTEASGGITEDSIVSYAETGVQFISVGALTHSYTSLDISLLIAIA
tara:strand:- start:245 stop:1099 length:855 start_codon:yes stop_codon:yes gene_type:complete